jgi:hypothetical protein
MSYEAGDAAVDMAVRGVDLGVDGMVVLELALDSGLGQVGRERVLDADALEEGEEAEHVAAEVGSCQQVIPLPPLLDEILASGMRYCLLEEEAGGGDAEDDWEVGEVEEVLEDETL